MPRLKLMVESTLHRYLSGELEDEEFKGEIQHILNEFKGKNLLHRNIGQLICMMQKENPKSKDRFERIWALLDQVSPRIREDCK